MRRKKAYGKENVWRKIKKWLSYIDPFTYSDIILERAGLKKNRIASFIADIITAFITALLFYALLGFVLGTSIPAVVFVSNFMVPTFERGDIIVMQGVSVENLDAKEVKLPYAIGNKPLASYAVVYCKDKSIGMEKECAYFGEKYKKGLIKETDFVATKICFKDANCYAIERKGDVVIYFSPTAKIPIIHRAVFKIFAKDGVFVLTKGDSVHNPVLDQQTFYSPAAVSVDELVGKKVFIIPKLGYIKLLLLDDLPCLLANNFDISKCKIP